ncbi:enoyl-CoA hydratase/isomerase family protein [Rothia nasimurium]|uniref:enoyl-CoA hydratase/isomerase family protein n=1 Tax=Rothia nasimurium TaxID=85336 RepID=UPI003B9E03A4
MTDTPGTQPTESVLTEKRGSLGVITLNRPRAVNALNYEMMQLMNAALDDFETDESVQAVLLRGAGDRGLCAGGDVVALYQATGEDPAQGVEFFRVEYALDLRIARYPKPFVALMDGLVLGGGVGVSAHSAYRIVTERTRTGMPETVIGFCPDVGGLNILARAPQNLGTLMAVTGLHVTGADALAVGMADYFVPSEKLDELASALEKITGADAVEQVISGFAQQAPSSQLVENASWIEGAFAADSVEEIIEAVQAVAESGEDGAEYAGTVLAALQKNGPTGMKVALEAVRRAGSQSLAETLNQDFVTSCNALAHHDMREGIRAQVVDKDRNPQWSPASLAEVSREDVLAFFTPTEAGELGLV